MDGIINIYKEKGFTSHDVVAKLRGILKQKKIGHTGTLDPDAQGVLPVCLGKATKVCDFLTNKDKTYEVVLKLGIITDTQDISGNVIRQSVVGNTLEEIRQIIQKYQGVYHQIPPMYSAIKMNGKKLYQMAREGKEIERPAREVTIYNIEILNENIEEKEITMRVSCSKGTYIRTLCHDIGNDLGCGGCMKTLLRTKVGFFEIKNSLTLSQVESLQENGEVEQHLVAIDDILTDYGVIKVKEHADKRIENGNIITEADIIAKESIVSLEHMHSSGSEDDNKREEKVKVYNSQGVFKAIYLYQKEKKQYKPVKMFL